VASHPEVFALSYKRWVFLPSFVARNCRKLSDTPLIKLDIYRRQHVYNTMLFFK
jgi:hypothetical protein